MESKLEVSKDKMSQEFDEILNTLSQFRKNVSQLQSQIKSVEKTVQKQLKVLHKNVEKNRLKGNRKPSGFAKPSPVTDELCQFMGKDNGTDIARTEVTQFLIQYIKNNNLQYADNAKIIKPDKTLKSLLGVEDQQEVTYFNLQGLMNKHFVKQGVSAEE